jgi:sensor domain CHASE-containing protein
MIIILINEYNKFDRGLKEKKIRAELRESLLSQKSRLEKALYSRIYFTRSVAAYVAVNSDISKESFNILAKEFISGDTVISTMSLARNCVIEVIYPLEGHEDAIGLELLKHPKRREMVEKSILTHQTFIAGPVELIEGGIAFISYTPVFTTFEGLKSNFWGVTDIVVYRDKLFNEVGLVASDSKFKYSMKGVDGSGNKGECFWGEPSAFENNPVIIEVQLPTGTWALAATPHIGWSDLIRQNESLYILLYLSAFIISLLVWLWAQALSKIRADEKELKALFGSMEDLIIEFNAKGEYVKIAPTNERLLILPKSEILGKKLHEVFDKENADFFYNAICKCLETKELVAIDYKLPINNKELWFRARISYLSENSVIFLAHDNTTVKIQEVAIIESEQKLKNLNIQKDKLFSIIAHDLKSPLGSFREITKLLYDEYDIFSENERKNFLQMIKESSNQVYELLENLLEWSRSQKGQLAFTPVELD